MGSSKYKSLTPYADNLGVRCQFSYEIGGFLIQGMVFEFAVFGGAGWLYFSEIERYHPFGIFFFALGVIMGIFFVNSMFAGSNISISNDGMSWSLFNFQWRFIPWSSIDKICIGRRFDYKWKDDKPYKDGAAVAPHKGRLINEYKIILKSRKSLYPIFFTDNIVNIGEMKKIVFQYTEKYNIVLEMENSNRNM